MPVQGEEPYEEDLEWLKYGREMIQESPRVLDEAARSFLTLGSSLLTVYTGALALFKFNEKASDHLSLAIMSTPILLWLLCISCFAYVYFPDRLRFRKNSPTDIEEVTRVVSRRKSHWLKIGSVIFVAALAATSFSIVWLGAQPAKEELAEDKIIQLIVADEDILSELKNSSGLPESIAISTIPSAILIQAKGDLSEADSSKR